ncbi:MAG: DnaA regulatory inactivator Hda [Burkholderiales bacterium]|nr:DnaA regulatory inactivator Hda [Burkholderiales bacterium]
MGVPSKPAGAPVGPLPFGTTGAPAGDLAGGTRMDALAPRHPQGVLDLVPQPMQSFDNFIVGDNAELVELLRGDAAAAPGRFFYLWGAPGAGRSHLLRAAAGAGVPAGRYMDLREPDAPLGIELLSDVQGRPIARLALDNVDALDAGGEQRLFNLYNTVRQEHPRCSLLVSGSRPPAALALRADLVTRLSWGLTYQVHPLTDLQKAAAMAAHARARGAGIGPDVLEWLLQTMPRDLPTLLAVVDSLDQYSLAAKRPATLPLAREWLRSLG